jgi:DNA replication and repair protein RecF
VTTAPVHSLAIEALSLRGFRNLTAIDLEPGARFNVISGDNGQGKTNLLEAVYALATSKSFRAKKPGELVRHGADVASVRATVREALDLREQSLGLKDGGRYAKIDGRGPKTLAAYAVMTPAVVFHPGEITLSMGSGSERRRLLDRVALYVAPASASELESYTRALRERQRALEVRGPAARDAAEWEELMVRHGVAVHEARMEAARRLALGAQEAFQRIGSPQTTLGVAYAPGSPVEAEAFRKALEASRVADARRGSAAVGPHRDDLALSLDGQSARGFASQGQHRMLVLALKAAESEVIGEARGVGPLLLLDDVSSELDRDRTSALFNYLQGMKGQVFLTTTRPELIELSGAFGAPRRDFNVKSGVVVEVSAPHGSPPEARAAGVRK